MRSIWASLALLAAITIAGCCTDQWYQWRCDNPNAGRDCDSRCPDDCRPCSDEWYRWSCEDPCAPSARWPHPPRYAEQGADVVIVGRIRTLDADHPEATGLVIQNGRISRITTADNAVRYASSSTRLITVPHDGVALPGFIESHAHLRNLGRSLREVDLRGATSAEDAAQKIAAAAQKAAPEAWILGRGWNQTGWGQGEWPNRMLLDQAAPGHPVALTRVDGHAMWVNSKALELAQISKASVEVTGGEILRDGSGEPTGVLIDNAMDPVQNIIGRMSTDDEARDDFLHAQQEAFKNGITTFVDAGETPEKLILLSGLYNEGKMKLRVYAMVGCSSAADLEAAFARAPAPSMFGDRLAVRAIKMYADGALGSRGAWLLAPYADRPGHYGFPVTDPTLFKFAVRGCLDRGYQLCAHAIGDRANRVVLDTIQAELDKTPNGNHRFRIEHAQLVQPDDLKKFRLNGVIASIQPCHATSDAAMAMERLGNDRLYAIGYQYKSMLQDWLHPAIGTDAPVESVSPVENYYAAVFRRDAAGRLTTPFMPEQQMNGLEALLGMTRFGAEATFSEDRRGIISPGYQGDVVILDRDIMTCEPEQILATNVMATIVAGEVVYQNMGDWRTIPRVVPAANESK